MEIYIYLIIIVAITLIGAIVTIRIGNSKENKKGDPTYDEKSGEKWARLTMFYVVAIVISVIALLIYMFM